MLDNDHAKGLLFTFLGVLALGPDTLIVRLIDINHWTLLFWRGLFIAIGILAVMSIRYRGGVGLVVRNKRALRDINCLSIHRLDDLFYHGSNIHKRCAYFDYY